MERFILLFMAFYASIHGLQAQTVIDIVDDKAMLNYGSVKIEMKCSLEIPEGEEPLQHHLSQILFADDNSSVKEAYNCFLKQWNGKLLDSEKEVGGLGIKTLTMNLCKEFEIKGRLACYHVMAKVLPIVFSDNKASSIQKTQLDRFKKGIDTYFIYDLQKHEVMKLSQILIPAAYENIVGKVGDELNLYTEDWCLQFSSPKGAGRFLINSETQKYYTDYFKELIQWESLSQDQQKPRFLRGEKGLHDFFAKEAMYIYASDGEPADTVLVSIEIDPEGNVTPVAVVSAPTEKDDLALQLCKKMPKWKPAVKDGVAVSSTMEVSVPFIKIIGDEPPQFIDGEEELRRYLSEKLIVPSNVGIQEKVNLEIIIEKDGSVTYVGTTNYANEYLKQQFIEKLEKMPKWKPAKKNGKIVRMKMSLPIRLNK